MKELEHIMEAVGFKVGTEDLEIVKVEDIFSDMNEAASNENTKPGTNDETKIKYEIEIELKQEPEEVSSAVSFPSSRPGRDLTAAVDGPAEKDFCHISIRTERREKHDDGMVHGQLQTVNAADGGTLQSLSGVVCQVVDDSNLEDIEEDPRHEFVDYEDPFQEADTLFSAHAVSSTKSVEIHPSLKAVSVRLMRLEEMEFMEGNMNCFNSVTEKSDRRRMGEIRQSDRRRKPVCYEEEEEESEVKSKGFKIKVVSNDYVTICGYCGTGLAGMKEVQEHLGMGNGHKYRCKVKRDMEMRRKAKSGETDHVCHVCWKGFEHKNLLAAHIVIHTKEKAVFRCDQCDKSCTTTANLNTHKKKVHEGIRYECPECGRKFGEKCHRTKHIKAVHLGEKNYKCHKCGMKFGRQGALKRHLMSVNVHKE